jgi:signal transduction histidine kinase
LDTTTPNSPDPFGTEAASALLQQLLSIARESALEEMASGMAHELNQPLGAIVTYAQAGERLLNRPDASLDKARYGVETTIADNGGGVADAYRTQIFRPFFTTKRPRERPRAVQRTCHRGVARRYHRLSTPRSTRQPLLVSASREPCGLAPA